MKILLDFFDLLTFRLKLVVCESKQYQKGVFMTRFFIGLSFYAD